MECFHRATGCVTKLFLKIIEAEIAAVRRAEQPAIGCKNVTREGCQFTEVFLDAKDFAFFIPRESGWV